MKKDNPQERPDIHLDYKDVFKAEELRDASFSSPYNFPLFKKTDVIPQKLIPFYKISLAKEKDFDSFVHFFLLDICFERLWKNTKKYLPLLSRFKGCLTPDFSMCYDFPYPQQLYNCYRNRVLGYILSQNNIPVIMNVSFSDPRTFDFCTNGIEHGGIIATGSLGTIRNKRDRAFFSEGLRYILSMLHPSELILYGAATAEICNICIENNVKLHLFTPQWDNSFTTKEVLHG